MAVLIRLGRSADLDAAISVYERSNLARRDDTWPDRATRLERARAHLQDPSAWFHVAHEGPDVVGMVSAEPLRADEGAGAVIAGGCFLALLFVAPGRWGEGIGGALLDAALAEARRRGYGRVRLWTDEDNERAQWLYRSRGFAPTGRIADDAGEWERHL